MKIFETLALFVVLLPTVAAAGDAPKKAPPPANPCAQYGAGFVQVKGTDTCVKLGGYTRVDAPLFGPRK